MSKLNNHMAELYSIYSHPAVRMESSSAISSPAAQEAASPEPAVPV